MQLYLLRHAIAFEHGHPDYPDDDQRPLTPKGRRRMKRIARGLAALGLDADRILTSPLPRAAQTADILRKAIGVDVEERDELKPEGRWELLLEWLAHQDPRPVGVVLVGHEPQLSQMACRLTTGRSGSWLDLKKGGLVHLDLELGDRPRATLKAVLTPRQMVAMA